MKKSAYIFLAIILGIFASSLLSIMLAGIAVDGASRLTGVIMMAFLLILVMMIGCVKAAIRKKELRSPEIPGEPPSVPADAKKPVFCGHCGRQTGEEHICPSCGALQPGKKAGRKVQ